MSKLKRGLLYNRGVIRNIGDIKDNIYYDENELDCINSRLFQISTLKKKYGTTIKEIIEYKNKIEKQYEDMVNSEEIIEKLKQGQKKSIRQFKRNSHANP